MMTATTSAPAASTPPQERKYFLTLLAYLYLDNHPDRVGFTGTHPELLQWGLGMGLVTPEEQKHYLPGNGTCKCC